MSSSICISNGDKMMMASNYLLFTEQVGSCFSGIFVFHPVHNIQKYTVPYHTKNT